MDKKLQRLVIHKLKNFIKKQNFMASFYGWGSTASRRLETLRGGILLFTTKSPLRPLKDERLSRPWSHPVVLNTGPLDW